MANSKKDEEGQVIDLKKALEKIRRKEEAQALLNHVYGIQDADRLRCCMKRLKEDNLSIKAKSLLTEEVADLYYRLPAFHKMNMVDAKGILETIKSKLRLNSLEGGKKDESKEPGK